MYDWIIKTNIRRDNVNTFVWQPLTWKTTYQENRRNI